MVCFAAFGSLFTGYSLAVFAFTIGQPTFYSSLRLEADSTSPGYAYTNDIIGAANGVFFGTGFLGCFLAGWAGDRFGRVNGFRIAAVTGTIGGVLQCASQVPAMVRLVSGLYVVLCLSGYGSSWFQGQLLGWRQVIQWLQCPPISQKYLHRILVG